MTVQEWNENAKRQDRGFYLQGQHLWLLDPITWANKRELLFTTDTGEDGNYMILRKDGRVEVGTFTEAFSNIGDALFTPRTRSAPRDKSIKLYESITKDLD
jgi:hypothetical protein